MELPPVIGIPRVDPRPYTKGILDVSRKAVSADEAKRISTERYEEFDMRRRQIENEADAVELLEAMQREIEKRAE
ncbi:hypothetical protein [Nocardia sp. NPDC049149]|uniref:hypothetical protein n=1 Tax=Nocardia sp. NPDC049149 TaxID=3364315 RepID=UPI00371CC366